MTNLPTPAELMREAIVIARGLTSGPHDLARAELLLKLARELRVGTPRSRLTETERANLITAGLLPLHVSSSRPQDYVRIGDLVPATRYEAHEADSECGCSLQGRKHGGPHLAVGHWHEDDAAPCFKIECHELNSGEYCTWCNSRPCRIPQDLDHAERPAEAPVSVPLWNRATETHPLDAPGIVADEPLATGGVVSGLRTCHVGEDAEAERSYQQAGAPWAAEEAAEQQATADLLVRMAAENGAILSPDPELGAAIRASEERAQAAWTPPESWRMDAAGHTDAATVAFGDDLTEVAERLRLNVYEGPTETLKTFAKRQADEAHAYLLGEISACQYCGNRIRFARMSEDHPSPQWYHTVSGQRVCPGAGMNDGDVGSINRPHTFATPMPIEQG